MKKNDLQMLLRVSIVASIYICLTVFVAPISYGAIQLRIAEVLVLLPYYKKEYSWSLIIGCAIANFFSPFGIIDVIFGTIATILSVFFITKTRKLLISSFFPVFFNGIIVGLEIAIFTQDAFWETFIASSISVAIGEAIVCLFGVLIFRILEKNNTFMELIGVKSEETRYNKFIEKEE